MAATREGRGKRQLLEENDICSTRLGRWSCSRGWPSWYPRHLREQQPFFARAKKVQKVTEYRDTAPLTVCIVAYVWKSRLLPYTTVYVYFYLWFWFDLILLTWQKGWSLVQERERERERERREGEGERGRERGGGREKRERERERKIERERERVWLAVMLWEDGVAELSKEGYIVLPRELSLSSHSTTYFS